MAIAKDNTLYESLFCIITSFGCQCQANFFYYLGMLQYLNIYNNTRDAASLLLFSSIIYDLVYHLFSQSV
ncbi:hypothetical protein BD408DRAFT_425925 [Parasitella parasitica]|nr:hypothetical protein BD408DRAFT_425925 [Parasitella parasitica]